MGVNEIFKTEFKGYSKKEVLEYIQTLNAQTESLKAELDNAESELEKYRAELNDIKPEPLSDTDIDELKASLREEVEQSVREQLYSEIKAQVESENTPVTGITLPETEVNELRSKAALYDEQKDILAELMIKVKSDAAQIYADAETRSRDLLDDTFDKFTKMREDFEQMRKNVDASKAEMDARISTISRYLDDFSQYLNIMEKDIINTGDNFKQEI